jgi:chitin synthase
MIVKIAIWNNVDTLGILITVGTLGLPGMIIVLTTGHIGYAFWMIIYFLALPIWNLILPIYAFSKFDDFTWGHTRKVITDSYEASSGTGPGGCFLIGSVPLKRYFMIINFKMG